jgi:hypothetical protein
MRRAKPGEPIEELRERSVSHAAADLATQIAGWAAAKREDIIETYCRGEVDFLPDREANLWSPLFAIASVAIPERLDELKTVALRLVGEKVKHDSEVSPATQLLSDIRTVSAAEATELMPTSRLLCELRNLPDSPWTRLSGNELARMLRPFESGRPDGTGLGLPLALKWLNAQGADLRLTPRPEGGTCAEIRW